LRDIINRGSFIPGESLSSVVGALESLSQVTVHGFTVLMVVLKRTIVVKSRYGCWSEHCTLRCGLVSVSRSDLKEPLTLSVNQLISLLALALHFLILILIDSLHLLLRIIV